MLNTMKLIMFFWPFLWELIAGKMSVKEAWRNNKRRVFLAIILVLSLSLNYRLIHNQLATPPAVDADRRDKEGVKSNKVEEPTPIDAPPHSTDKNKKAPEQGYDRYGFVSERLDYIVTTEEKLH